MNIFTDPETIVLWLILLLPVFLSLLLYLYVRCLTSRWYKGEEEEQQQEDEEIAYPSSTIDPPSYIASYQDQLFQTQQPSHLMEHEKPPDYPSPPSYEDAFNANEDDEEMTLDQVKQNVLLQKRQRLLLAT